jgi:hypothetical protein
MTDEAWNAVERAVDKMRQRLSSATHPEDSQGIGHLAREALISLAQAVHDRSTMPTLDGVDPSDTDAKRRLEAFIAASLPGASNDELRKLRVRLSRLLTASLTCAQRRTAMRAWLYSPQRAWFQPSPSLLAERSTVRLNNGVGCKSVPAISLGTGHKFTTFLIGRQLPVHQLYPMH